MDLKRILGSVALVLALPVGAVVGLFTAGPALFSDGGGVLDPERLTVLAVSAVAFLALGFLVGLAAPQRWVLGAWLLFAPVVIVVAFFGLASPDLWLLGIAFVLVDGGASFLGGELGHTFRRRGAAG